MKKIIVLLIVTLLIATCGKSKLFTEVDFNFTNLKDVYPKVYQNQPVEFINKKITLPVSASKTLIGLYGELISLESIENNSAKDAKSNFEALMNEMKEDKLTAYNKVISAESKFNFVTKDKLTGMIWTRKSFLFKVIAKNKEELQKFLMTAKLAKLN